MEGAPYRWLLTPWSDSKMKSLTWIDRAGVDQGCCCRCLARDRANAAAEGDVIGRGLQVLAPGSEDHVYPGIMAAVDVVIAVRVVQGVRCAVGEHEAPGAIDRCLAAVAGKRALMAFGVEREQHGAGPSNRSMPGKKVNRSGWPC
jgi:hypothetical protein